MNDIIYRTLYLFFEVLEIILLTYVLMSWFPLGTKLKELIENLTAPILTPIRFLMKHSIFYSQLSDMSPLIGFIVISYLQQLFYIQLM